MMDYFLTKHGPFAVTTSRFCCVVFYEISYMKIICGRKKLFSLVYGFNYKQYSSTIHNYLKKKEIICFDNDMLPIKYGLIITIILIILVAFTMLYYF
ncbi:unnamed protein product [Trifolium pratense]|uniref:Uncharacterized protein n=1 Tax=Trifolium pratense TaxID=57577 RepID=A0ACB0LSD8_TRIPR|nr:unnamed protein product [Trifolium pratense]